MPRALAAEGTPCTWGPGTGGAPARIGTRVAHFAPLAGVSPPAVTVKEMRSRWGSCTAKGRVSLALGSRAADAGAASTTSWSTSSCHLRELNHGPRFWRRVEEVLPDYRERRERLRVEGRVAAL